MFKQLFDINDFGRHINKEVNALEKIIIENLIKIGRRYISDVLVNREYKDQTFDLRSSTGFCIFNDGVLIYEEIDGNPEGVEEGLKLARFVGNSHEGIVLAVVAGMYYSVYLEAKGRDVITGSSYAAANNHNEIFSKLKASMKKR